MSQTLQIFDQDGDFCRKKFDNHATKIRHTSNIFQKTQGLGLLQDYFKYIRRLEDIHHPALAAFWVSHLFDELIELLSTPLTRSKAQQEHIELYCTALECMKNIVDATWSPNSQAISYLWECTPAILLEQKNAYQKAINPLKSRLREQLIEVFGSLTVDHREDGPILSEREPLDKEFLLTLVYDLYFEPQVPPHWFITVYRARQILFDLAPDSYGAEPYPYVKNIVYWGGEHNIVRRYIGLAHSAGRTAPLDAETAWHILTDLSMVKSMQKRLFKQSSAHVVTMSLYWQDLRREDKRGIESPDDETARMVLASINHIIKMLDDNLRPAVIRDLVQDDLILVFGRALFTEEDLTTWINDMEPVFTNHKTYSRIRSHADMEIARPQWAYVWRRLQNYQRSTFDPDGVPPSRSALDFWLRLGEKALSVSPKGYWELASDAADTQACGRLKCPRYGETCEGEWTAALVPSQCTGCFKVNYCSLACQKLDWTEGYHKRICKP